MKMSTAAVPKPHAVCIPFPAQGHITPMLKLAKLLHHLHGFHITFVNTERSHNRLLESATSSLNTIDDFHFLTIPDGLSPASADDFPALLNSVTNNFSTYLRHLLDKLKVSRVPPVSCFVSDGVMSFTLELAAELGIPDILFWTTSACGFMAYLHFKELVDRGMVPITDETALTNGYLETPTEWLPGMKNTRLRDFPTFVRTTCSDDTIFNYCNHEAQRAVKATSIIFNTFYDLEYPVIDAMSTMLPPIYTLGSLTLLTRHICPESPLTLLGSNLWKEDIGCLKWLDERGPRSVVYISYGSTTTMNDEQLMEFAWGLANSGYDFLWLIRPDLVKGDSAVLPPELMKAIGVRGLLVSWCNQEEVLTHKAIGCFLTHCGWNSMMECISVGVPMLCWPFCAEQPTNCRYACTEWGVGMELDEFPKREHLEAMIREVMGGEKGNEMRMRALEWKEKAVTATEQGGTSFLNLEQVVNKMMLTGSRPALPAEIADSSMV